MKSLMKMPDATLIGIQTLTCSIIISIQLQIPSPELKCIMSKQVRRKVEILTAHPQSLTSKLDATLRTMMTSKKKLVPLAGMAKRTSQKLEATGEPRVSTKEETLLAIQWRRHLTTMPLVAVSRVNFVNVLVLSSIPNCTMKVIPMQLL